MKLHFSISGLLTPRDFLQEVNVSTPRGFYCVWVKKDLPPLRAQVMGYLWFDKQKEGI